MNLHIIYDLDLDTWTSELTGDGSWVDVDLGFVGNGNQPVHFEDLAFGWTLTVNGEAREPSLFPEGDSRYVMSDMPCLVTVRELCQPGDGCELAVWVTETGVEASTTIQFDIPEGDDDGDDD